MRWPALRTHVLILAGLLSLTGCGGSSPAGPSGTAQPASAEYKLLIMFRDSCPSPDGNALTLLPVVHTRVTLTAAGTEWIIKAASARAGDVELRFHGIGPQTESVAISGTIKGTARHMPELVPNLPAWDSRVEFGADGATTVSGFGLRLTPLSQSSGADGSGSGAIALTNGTHRCSGTSFSWSLLTL